MTALRFTVRAAVPGLSIDARVESAHGRLALFGPSGAGKTTFLRALAGFGTAEQVKLVLGDVTLCQSDSGPNPKPHERDMAFVFQDDRLFPHLSVSDNIAYGAKDDQQAIREAIDVADCASLLERTTAALSGGERRRVSIARALAKKPALLLLDEPYNGLDRPSATALRYRLAKHLSATKTSFVLVTHVLDDVLAHDCDIALLCSGKVISAGRAEDVFSTKEGRTLLADADDTARTDVVSLYRVTNQVERASTGLMTCEIAPGISLRIPATTNQRPSYLKVRASDVSIALVEPTDTSVLNVIPAEVTAIDDAEPYAMIDLAVGPSLVLKARITSYSCERLGLAPGKKVFAQIKSVALAN